MVGYFSAFLTLLTLSCSSAEALLMAAALPPHSHLLVFPAHSQVLSYTAHYKIAPGLGKLLKVCFLLQDLGSSCQSASALLDLEMLFMLFIRETWSGELHSEM